MTDVPDASAASFVFGTAGLGLPYGLGRAGEPPALMPETAVSALVEAALRAGITVFDTAPAYGVAEERLGRALGARGVVWTKLGRHESIGPSLADDAVASLEVSLARLRRPKVELLQWHNWTAGLASDAHFRACWARLASDPRVAALGASTYGPVDALAAVESGLFRVVQVEWNVLNPWVLDAVGEAARRHDVAIAVRSVFLQGALTDEGRDLPPLPALAERVARAREVAREAGVSVRDLALRSALGHPGIRHVLMGLDRVEQIEEAVAVASAGALPSHVAEAVRGLKGAWDDALDPRTWGAAKRS